MRVVGLFFLFFVSLSLFSQTDTTKETSRIFWSDWYKLEWADFQGEPIKERKVAALSNIALPYHYSSDGEGEMTVEINVCFLKETSWSKEKLQNKVLLQHEQLHFDIAELHRRKIIKAISEADFSKDNHKQLLEEIINKIWVREYRKMQDEYDSETNYSRVFKAQIKWNKFVAQQLRNLEDYKFTEVEVSLIQLD